VEKTFKIIIIMVIKDLKLYNHFIYCNVTFYELQFFICLCKLQLTANVEFLRYILI